MENKKHLFLINPNTSRNRIKQQKAEEIKEVCDQDGLDYEIYWAHSPEEAASFVLRKSKEYEELRVYICGGDGTVNNILNAAYQCKNIEFGVIPLGSGNDFVRTFGEHSDYLDIRKMLYGTSMPVDLIRANDRICVNMLNIGFDEKVVSFVQKRRDYRIMRSAFAYTISALVQLAGMPMEHAKVTFDDGTVVDKKFLLCAIANGSYCGGGYYAASNAEPDDGLIDVLLINPIHRTTFLKILGRYKSGTILNTPIGKKMIIQKKCRTLIMEKDTEFEVCNDGDIYQTKRLECEILPGKVRLITPVKGSIL